MSGGHAGTGRFAPRTADILDIFLKLPRGYVDGLERRLIESWGTIRKDTVYQVICGGVSTYVSFTDKIVRFGLNVKRKNMGDLKKKYVKKM